MNPSARPPFDSAPLSWVMDEVRAALAQSRAALESATPEALATPLQHARSHLHQVAGALQMVDVDGVAPLLAAAEQLIEALKNGSVALSAAARADLAGAYEALLDYLEELLAGALPQPLRLYPYYRALRLQLGAERIHPADLLALDLDSFQLAPPAVPQPADLAACRARFEKGLLLFLKSADPAAARASAAQLAEALGAVADAQSTAAGHTFWRAMHAVAALVAAGQLAPDLNLKQLLGMINLQMRRLAQGQGSEPPAMLRDALFFVAAAPGGEGDAAALRAGFGLAGQVPEDYAQPRYAQLDRAAVQGAQAALAAAKAAADGQDNDALAAALSALEQACAALPPALAGLSAAMARAQQLSQEGLADSGFGLELATALLLTEHGLAQVRRLSAGFADQAALVSSRLQALAAGEAVGAAPDWHAALLRQLEQGQTLAALSGEILHSLRTVEKALEDFSEDPGRLASLAELAPVLKQVRAAFAMLDLGQAQHAVDHIGASVKRWLDSGGAGAGELDNLAQNVGALGFFTGQLGRDLEGTRLRFGFDPDAGLFGEGRSGASAAPAAPAPALVAAPADSAVDAELLEIFIGEAQDVLAAIFDALPALQADPADQDAMTRLRRSFHTLKGSGRMVALDQLADAAAAIEKVLNAWLAEARRATPELLALIEQAADSFSRWVDDLVAQGVSQQQAEPLVDAALAVLEGTAPTAAAHAADVEPPAEAALDLAALEVGTDLDADAALAALDFAAPEEVAPQPEPEALAAQEPALADDSGMPGPIDLAQADLDLDSVLAETPAPSVAGDDLEHELPDLDFDSVAEQAAAPLEDAQPAPEPDAEALPSSAKVIEFPSVVPNLPPDDNSKRIGDIEIPLPLFNIFVAEADEIMRLLEREFGEWRIERPRPVKPEALKAIHTLSGTAGTVGYKALRELALALEMTLQELQPPAPAVTDTQFDLLDAALAAAGQMLQAFARGELAAASGELVADLYALRAGLREQPGLNPEQELAARLEELFRATYEAILANPPVMEPVSLKTLEPRPSAKVVDEIDDLFAAAFDTPVAAPPLPAPEPAPLLEEEPAPLPLLSAEALPPAPALAGLPADEIDADLLPVFLEEGTDLFPEIGNALRRWQANPADGASAKQVLRALHTVKGSARMAGAMRLGQHTHDIETQVDNMLHAGTSTPEAFDDLLANFDQALLMFEQLQQGPEPAGAVGGESAPTDDEAAARVPLVRVRADILDRLVNQAGEVAIARSKLENQVGAMKAALGDFGENLARLRRQLREVEVQAESQIASRLSIAGEREFDPLEFDRFTRLQELTRMMAESVSDVGALHEGLARNVDRAGEDLLQQARMTRELQHDLMRVRMVPFASISERLFRVARQGAKELDKRVNLDIRGAAVEMDRSVLEQMAGPFEHLLRNAIVHGIEARAERLAAGKPEAGELLIQVSQQGNEVVLQFSDDGAGLNLARIRAKAVEHGLLGEPDEVDDAEAANLIFEPGFSTAASLTEMAGRGVGMDVVRSEAQALGGRVQISTEAGKGTRFTIHLPLTLAVTQVVLVQSGGRTYALPSALVETLMQVKESAAAEARAAGQLEFRGKRLALHYLSHLLGDGAAEPLAQRSCPLLVLQHGEDRLALQVDHVIGNREVVVKNIGPQLSRMAGVAGATVLGSGDIVLILNPVTLAHYLQHHPELRSYFTAAPAHAAATARLFTIMVVDDSVTVRKVTQRLLEREGYQVMLAKDGVDALEQLQDHKPDLMLVDIEMPRMDGFDLVRSIRGNEATQSMPLIMITSRSADKHRNLALELGVNAYFGKPYQEPILLAAISGLLPAD